MKKRIRKFFKENRGASEITQSFLLIGVAISLVLTIFFPSVKKALGSATEGLEGWLTETTSEVFDIDTANGN